MFGAPKLAAEGSNAQTTPLPKFGAPFSPIGQMKTNEAITPPANPPNSNTNPFNNPNPSHSATFPPATNA
jgi:hypothetical protein